MTETKFCANCGAEIDVKAMTCPGCGVLQQDQKVNIASIKNEGIAAVLSFFFCGLGQIYNGQIGKGITLIVIQVINATLMFVTLFLWSPVYFVVWIFGIWDAYTTAKKINEGTESA